VYRWAKRRYCGLTPSICETWETVSVFIATYLFPEVDSLPMFIELLFAEALPNLDVSM